MLDIDFEPNQLFHEIVLDPRLSEKNFELRKNIYRELGFEGSIVKSSLYNIPFDKI